MQPGPGARLADPIQPLRCLWTGAGPAMHSAPTVAHGWPSAFCPGPRSCPTPGTGMGQQQGDAPVGDTTHGVLLAFPLTLLPLRRRHRLGLGETAHQMLKTKVLDFGGARRMERDTGPLAAGFLSEHVRSDDRIG